MAGMSQSTVKQQQRPAEPVNFDFNAGNYEEEKKGHNELANLGADPMAAFQAASANQNGQPPVSGEQV